MPAAERTAILEAAAARAAGDGWSWACIEHAAQDCGFDRSLARRCFPNGLPEALDALDALFDARALERFAPGELAGLPVRERIAALVRARLEVMASWRPAIRRLAVHNAPPLRAAAALRRLARTVDAIWRTAGDTATEFDWYTKRALLAGVYSASLMCWLGDNSEDFAVTAAFVDRRIADALRLGKAGAGVTRAAAVLGRPLECMLRAVGRTRARRGFSGAE